MPFLHAGLDEEVFVDRLPYLCRKLLPHISEDFDHQREVVNERLESFTAFDTKGVELPLKGLLDLGQDRSRPQFGLDFGHF